jgi:glycerate kinase
MTAQAAAAALADGWRSVRPGDEVRLMPMADGGEGTLDAFETAVPGARRMPVAVTGPDGRRVEASWLLLPGADERGAGESGAGGVGEGVGGARVTGADTIGVVELASTSGITLLDPLRPFEAHTYGFGEAIAAALDHGVSRLLLAIGGSSSTDGGAGALHALGALLKGRSGEEVPPGNAGLAELESIDLSGLRPLPTGGVQILSDVTNPLLGESGAAAVFGPQKGAGDEDIPVLERNLGRLAALLPVDAAEPGTGAAGGVGFGLLAWGAVMAPGSAAVGDAIGLPNAAEGADILVTGEGRYDSQSDAGKVPAYVATVAEEAGAGTMLVAGSIQAPTDRFAAAVSLVELASGLSSALADPKRWLEAAGAQLASSAGSTSHE